MSTPPECCIAGAAGQPWPGRSTWLVAFGSSGVGESDELDRDDCLYPNAGVDLCRNFWIVCALKG